MANHKIPIGISACVLGHAVRFNGGHKRSAFVERELGQYVEFHPLCPEVAIGLPVPRPMIRLVTRDDSIRLVETRNPDMDYTDAMQSLAAQRVPAMTDLCGYILAGKSPSCGMERVKLYLANGNTVPGGASGLFAAELMAKMPWLPVEEDGRLGDPRLRENFILRVFALDDLYRSVADGITASAIIRFHSRYKLILMAHCQAEYRALGQMVAHIADWDPDEFFQAYRLKLMTALKTPASRRNNTNVMMHVQGYFKKCLSARQKAELGELIHNYRQGLSPLLAPMTLLNHYLGQYPNDYLASQRFFKPYPKELKLRYGV